MGWLSCTALTHDMIIEWVELVLVVIAAPLPYQEEHQPRQGDRTTPDRSAPQWCEEVFFYESVTQP
jgi:hypothetical protein